MRRLILRRSRKLVGRRTYTAGELLKVLQVHRQTLRTWRGHGLTPISLDSRPWLYFGQSVKEFLSSQAQSRKCKLAPGEFYCLKCKAGRKSTAGGLGRIVSTKRVGKDRVSTILLGLCEVCGCKLRRVASIPVKSLENEGGV